MVFPADKGTIGPLYDLIEHIEVATRPDGVGDFRSQLFSSVHPNIVAGVAPIRPLWQDRAGPVSRSRCNCPWRSLREDVVEPSIPIRCSVYSHHEIHTCFSHYERYAFVVRLSRACG